MCVLQEQELPQAPQLPQHVQQAQQQPSAAIPPDNLTSYAKRSCTAENVAELLTHKLMSPRMSSKVHTHPDDQLQSDKPAIPEAVSAQAFPNQAAALSPATPSLPSLRYLTRGSYGAVSTTQTLSSTTCMINVNVQACPGATCWSQSLHQRCSACPCNCRPVDSC